MRERPASSRKYGEQHMSEKPKDSTLTDFLLARLAEDEQRAADLESVTYRPRWTTTAETGQVLGTTLLEDCKARALAECEAKRRIVEGLTQDAPTMHDGLRERFEQSAVEWAWMVAKEGTLAALAAPYAGHPDYREEWKP